MEGYITEIFRSIQGEGLYLGVAQVFMRLSGCALGCSYCDTPRSAERARECAFLLSGGEERMPNPLTPARAISAALRFIEEEGGVHSLSVTGGEPLEQPGFTREISILARESGLPVYLETNGLPPDALGDLATHCDFISLDIKLPSLCGGEDLFPLYRKGLSLLNHREYFCKIVIAEGFDFEEFEEAVKMLAGSIGKPPLVIQPATAVRASSRSGSSLDVDTGTILRCMETAARYIDDVRVIPQCHGLLGVL